MLITTISQKIENWALGREIVYKLVAQYYHDVIEKEVVLANITRDDHILCIGGGICPFSAILLHQTTGAKVTVIDNNDQCVPKARKIIERLGIGAFVKVLCQDGGSAGLNFAKYTVVHFALQVCPMECVFSHVERHVAPGTKLLVRRPKGNLKKIYSGLNNPKLHSCPLTTHKKARNIGSTLLYVKQPPPQSLPGAAVTYEAA
ncbi:MAG: class I SAM-dependent methyltransferase [Defluviitaleaceae bacterium]|nr:class I SAM-dependent methyltransferase [Defluviitaleaceae bacterium]